MIKTIKQPDKTAAKKRSHRFETYWSSGSVVNGLVGQAVPKECG